MRVLMLTYRFPYPPDRGDKVRPYHFARMMAGQHEVHLLTFGRKGSSDASQLDQIFASITEVPFSRLRANLHLAPALLRGQALQLAYFDQARMHGAVRAAVHRLEPDVIYAYHLRMAPYLAPHKRSHRVLDLVDAVSLFMTRMMPHAPRSQRPLLRRELPLIRSLERGWAKFAEEAWLSSPVDLAALPQEARSGPVIVVPNGVDAAAFRPLVPHERRAGLLFVGYMGAESQDALAWFCERVLPRVRHMLGRPVELRIVGANAPARIRRLTKMAGVQVEGFVGDLCAAYNQAAVLIAPMRFVAGIQNKVLEAMACETAVVATPYANEGIEARAGEQIEIAETAGEFAAKTARLLEDTDRRRQIARAARTFVAQRFRWDVVLDRLGEIENLLVARREHGREDRSAAPSLAPQELQAAGPARA
ncbi:MAG: glycosyltransferase [Armatimonadota bacterium]